MGNKTPINSQKLKEESDKIINTCLLFCSRCFHICSVKPFILKDDLYVSLYCKCLYDERKFMPFEDLLKLSSEKKVKDNFCNRHKKKSGFLYCIFCEKWLCDSCFIKHKTKHPSHHFSHIPIKLKEYCDKHQKNIAVGYCKTCESNVCVNCLKDTQKLRHDVYEFNNQNTKDISENSRNLFMEKQNSHNKKNLELKDEMINNINNTYDLKEQEKKSLIEKIDLYYNKNKEINNKLSEYILFLFSTFDYASKISQISNYNICHNIMNLKFNNPNFTLNFKEPSSINTNVEKLIGYYQDIHLVEMKPLVCLKNISSERHNVINQIAKIVLLDENTFATLISKGIVIVWNYMTYEELYRIKKITIQDKNNDNAFLDNNINDIIQNYILDEDIGDLNNINIINNNIIQQQFDILNQIQGNFNNNMFNINNEIKKVNIIKVYHQKKINVNNDINSDSSEKKELKIENTEEKEDNIEDNIEEELDQNYNFTSIAFIKKYKILALIIENYNEIYLFNIYTKQALYDKLIGHKKEVLEIISLKNDDLASYGKDFTIRIWNMKHFQNVTTINVEIQKNHIYFKQLLYGNLIFATNKQTIKIIKLPEYEFLPDIKAVSSPIDYFQLPDKRLIIASDDYYIRIYEPPDYINFTLLSKSRQKIYSFVLLDINRVLIGIEDNGAYSLNILKWGDKGDKITRYDLGNQGFRSPIGSMVKTKNKRVITISWDNLIKIFIIGN